MIDEVQKNEQIIIKKQKEILDNKSLTFIQRTEKWTELEKQRKKLRDFLSVYRFKS